MDLTPAGAYLINAVDLFSECGFIPGKNRETSNSFLIPNNEAEVYSYTWGDGKVDWDLSAPVVLVPRTFILDGSIMAKSAVDFWDKYNKLIALIRSPGPLIIFVRELQKNFAARRKAYTKFDRFTPLLTGSPIIVDVRIELTELIGVELPADPEPFNVIAFLSNETLISNDYYFI